MKNIIKRWLRLNGGLVTMEHLIVLLYVRDDKAEEQNKRIQVLEDSLLETTGYLVALVNHLKLETKKVNEPDPLQPNPVMREVIKFSKKK